MKLTTEKIKKLIQLGPVEEEKRCQEKLRERMEEYIQTTSAGDEYQRLRTELIRANSMPGRSGEEGGSSGGYKNSDNILKVLEQTERGMREYRDALYAEMQRTADELQLIRRFKIIYRKLPREWQNWLEKLYKERLPWKVVEAESRLRHEQFVFSRKQILDDMCRLYNMPLTDAQLVNVEWEVGREARKPLNKPKREDDGQLTLDFGQIETEEKESDASTPGGKDSYAED